MKCKSNVIFVFEARQQVHCPPYAAGLGQRVHPLCTLPAQTSRSKVFGLVWLLARPRLSQLGPILPLPVCCTVARAVMLSYTPSISSHGSRDRLPARRAPSAGARTSTHSHTTALQSTTHTQSVLRGGDMPPLVQRPRRISSATATERTVSRNSSVSSFESAALGGLAAHDHVVGCGDENARAPPLLTDRRPHTLSQCQNEYYQQQVRLISAASVNPRVKRSSLYELQTAVREDVNDGNRFETALTSLSQSLRAWENALSMKGM